MLPLVTSPRCSRYWAAAPRPLPPPEVPEKIRIEALIAQELTGMPAQHRLSSADQADNLPFATSPSRQAGFGEFPDLADQGQDESRDR